MIIRKYDRIRIFIMKLTRPDQDQWCRLAIYGTKISSTGFINLSNHDTSNIPNISNMKVNLSLGSQAKCDNTFSDPESDHIYSHFLGTYLVYILFLLLCGNYSLTLKRGRCRNLLSIDSQLNQIYPSTNIISSPNSEHGYRTKFENLLGVAFQYIIE